jgi:hypothetical protein
MRDRLQHVVSDPQLRLPLYLSRCCNKGDHMRLMPAIALILAATGAQAHPGHLAEVAGHAHWVGAAAIGLAVLVGLWGKGKDKSGDADAEAEDDQEEAAA